jgi:endonuclease YncB( thermonuclease family)
MRRVLAALIAFLPAVALADVTGPTRVIDGDTIDSAGQFVRLFGIDASERDQPCRRNEASHLRGAAARASPVVAGASHPSPPDRQPRSRARKFADTDVVVFV